MNHLPLWSASALPELLGMGVSYALLCAATMRGLSWMLPPSDQDSDGDWVSEPGREVERSLASLRSLVHFAVLPLALYLATALAPLLVEAKLAALPLWAGATLQMGSPDPFVNALSPSVAQFLGPALLPILSFLWHTRPFPTPKSLRKWREQYAALRASQSAESLRAPAILVALFVALVLLAWLAIFAQLRGLPAGSWLFVLAYQVTARCIKWCGKRPSAPVH